MFILILFVEEVVFSSVVYSCLFCHRLTARISAGSLLGSLFCPIGLYVFVLVPYCFDDCSFVE